jgi:hypothetical protein
MQWQHVWLVGFHLMSFDDCHCVGRAAKPLQPRKVGPSTVQRSGERTKLPCCACTARLGAHHRSTACLHMVQIQEVGLAADSSGSGGTSRPPHPCAYTRRKVCSSIQASCALLTAAPPAALGRLTTSRAALSPLGTPAALGLLGPLTTPPAALSLPGPPAELGQLGPPAALGPLELPAALAAGGSGLQRETVDPGISAAPVSAVLMSTTLRGKAGLAGGCPIERPASDVRTSTGCWPTAATDWHAWRVPRLAELRNAQLGLLQRPDDCAKAA